MPLPESSFEIVLAHRVCLESSGAIARGMIECASLDFGAQTLSSDNTGLAQAVRTATSETRKNLYRLAGGIHALGERIDESLRRGVQSAVAHELNDAHGIVVTAVPRDESDRRDTAAENDDGEQ